jgi:hypothetical protein
VAAARAVRALAQAFCVAERDVCLALMSHVDAYGGTPPEHTPDMDGWHALGTQVKGLANPRGWVMVDPPETS